MSLIAHSLYALAWLSFGLVHSVLATRQVKGLLQPFLGRGYRLLYNLFALIYIALVIYGSRYLLGDGLGPFHFAEPFRLALLAMMFAGAVIFVVALLQYDLGLFSGLSQLFKTDSDTQVEPLQMRGLNRFVRHPLYSGAHLYLWGAVRSEFDLMTAIWASCYLVIGAHFEERKLIADYGTAYRDYKARVPSLIPWRGRAR